MNLIDSQDLTCVDFDELGIRPLGFTEECDEMNLDEAADGYLTSDKLRKLSAIYDGEKTLLGQTDDDDSDYDIDPETGEKIFGAPSPLAVGSSFSFTNDKWVIDYLTRIESSSSSLSSSSQDIPVSGETFFNELSFTPEPTPSSWFSNFISPDESPSHMMFAEQRFVPTHNDGLYHMPVMHMPLPDRHMPESFATLMNAPSEEDYPVVSSHGGRRRQRLVSSLESDSTTRDSDQTFDGTYLEAKQEKIEHDEHSMAQLFNNRMSNRVNLQGQQDEDALRRYNIPLSVEDITQSSTEDYNRQLSQLAYLNAEQMHVIKDIRRRGKNKIAAQNCRKRKAISVDSLREEVDQLKRMKHELEQRRESYQQQIADARSQYVYLHKQMLPNQPLPPPILVK